MGEKNNNQNKAVAHRNEEGSVHPHSGRIISYQGPLPPAGELKKYNDVLPGAADRIITMAEKQATHRQKQESRVILGDNIRSFIGLFFGFIIVISAIICGTLLILKGHSAWGLSVVISALGTIIGAFAWSKRQREKEVKTKREAETKEEK